MGLEAMEGEDDQPLTPIGRIFLRPEMEQVVNCVLGMKHPIDVEAIKAEIKNSVLVQHPRFCSVLVRDKGREYWRRTKVEIERHFLVRDIESDGDGDGDGDEDEVVNEYLADLAVSTPLNTDKPLWEFHLLRAQRCCVLRFHHALGDGTSLVSLILACCRRVDHPDQPPTISSSSSTIKQKSKSSRNICSTLWRFMVVAWFTFVFVLAFLLRSFWVKDAKTALSGGAGVELWPRKMATARFDLEDMKTVKKAIADATINDVLIGMISSGLSRYLNLRTAINQEPREGLQITVIEMVNLRKQPGLQDLTNMMRNKSGSRWGNQIGLFLLPLHYHKDVDALRYVKRVILDQKKQSWEAQFSYWVGHIVMSLFGPKVVSFFTYRIFCNTSFMISNIVGPQEEIMIAGNPITFLRANVSSLPHAITMHMVSYAGRADMQILVAKEIIPDPQVLAKCIQDALLEMKDAATALATTNSIEEGNFS